MSKTESPALEWEKRNKAYEALIPVIERTLKVKFNYRECQGIQIRISPRYKPDRFIRTNLRSNWLGTDIKFQVTDLDYRKISRGFLVPPDQPLDLKKLETKWDEIQQIAARIHKIQNEREAATLAAARNKQKAKADALAQGIDVSDLSWGQAEPLGNGLFTVTIWNLSLTELKQLDDMFNQNAFGAKAKEP